MITKLVAPWFGWQDRRPPAARGWPHLCRPPTRGEASHPPRSALLFANLASQRQPRLDFANIIFVFPLYLQAILHLVNLTSARQPILDFQMLSLYMWCICIALYLLAAALLVSDRHLDIANITNFCSPTPGKLDHIHVSWGTRLALTSRPPPLGLRPTITIRFCKNYFYFVNVVFVFNSDPPPGKLVLRPATTLVNTIFILVLLNLYLYLPTALLLASLASNQRPHLDFALYWIAFLKRC